MQEVKNHIRTYGNEQGYRNIWHSLRIKGISTIRDMVMSVLRELDPEGAVLRKKNKLNRRSYRSNGPNDVWHVDGYDKLKPFGFPIHGCIDGYSRKMIWLTYVKSNNDPYIVGKLYFGAVKELGKVPNRVRTDCGTENIFIVFKEKTIKITMLVTMLTYMVHHITISVLKLGGLSFEK